MIEQTNRKIRKVACLNCSVPFSWRWKCRFPKGGIPQSRTESLDLQFFRLDAQTKMGAMAINKYMFLRVQMAVLIRCEADLRCIGAFRKNK